MGLHPGLNGHKLLHIAGVKFAVLGGGESCTGDPARRLGNEFLFQMLGQGNVEMLNEVREGEPLEAIAAAVPGRSRAIRRI